MKFFKYPKIVNVDNTKVIQKMEDEIVMTRNWHIFEKIDGANFSVYYRPETGEMKFARRTDFLKDDESFYGWQDYFMEEWKETFKKEVREFCAFAEQWLYKWYDEHLDYIVFYGEFFGNGIQKRINYGEKQFLIFDVALHTKEGNFTFLPFIKAVAWIPEKYLALPIDVVSDFNKAIETDVESLVSKYSPTGDLAEGIVIKPNVPIWNRFDKRFFMLKKKRQAFKERKAKPKVKVDNKFDYLQPIVQTGIELVNENRLKSAESKLGKFESMEQLGDFIKEINKDILADFKDLEQLNKQEQHYVKKELNRAVVNFLKGYLLKEA